MALSSSAATAAAELALVAKAMLSDDQPSRSARARSRGDDRPTFATNATVRGTRSALEIGEEVDDHLGRAGPRDARERARLVDVAELDARTKRGEALALVSGARGAGDVVPDEVRQRRAPQHAGGADDKDLHG